MALTGQEDCLGESCRLLWEAWLLINICAALTVTGPWLRAKRAVIIQVLCNSGRDTV